eukprot:CAMPEP_0175126502 /NCGR_PEP_ID=MMETSP0087-20121206/3890_1 /TAXON_ID=136419 /ORGANISM="Unknown Unknown, Strain D1" /LENGTH=457 /DNA_ID=CAMNT_0016408423 /DNA_START=143 /DNA_END=1516 /DNA_ORIENTATION=+
MKSEGLSPSFVKSFENVYRELVKGESGVIPEASISAAGGFPSWAQVQATTEPDPQLLQKTVFIKLNGGLGTSMGLSKAKSLLTAKDGKTFLDLLAEQVSHLRRQHSSAVEFLLMNSYATSADSMQYLQQHKSSLDPFVKEVVQNKAPKVDASTFQPVEWPKDPAKEWCPPGHGDFYAALSGSGLMDQLLAAGYKYVFVSNSDNLGASLDLALLTHFAQSGQDFLMEVCERTEADKKGGHLAVRNRDGRLVLREGAQCSAEDEAFFEDVSKHRYFNTNNVWIRLDALKQHLKTESDIIPLPMIKNPKTVDPTDDTSTAVIQLETAIGAAIEVFDKAGAIVVPRTRFAPVKKCNDLFLLRSDAYELTSDSRPVIRTDSGLAPLVSLDKKAYKTVQQLDAIGAVPSLKGCKSLGVHGLVAFEEGVVIKGDVTFVNNAKARKTIAAGVYEDVNIDLAAKEL